MLKVNEFCCGFDLRTGSLIILWCTLIVDGYRSLFYFAKLLYETTYRYSYELSPFATIFRDFAFFCASFTGLVISVIGLYGIQKIRAEFLNTCYLYYIANTGYWLILSIIVVIFPTWYYDLTILSPFHLFPWYEYSDFPVLLMVGCWFAAALTSYLAVAIRSYASDLKTVNGFDRNIPDASVLGYNQDL